MSTDIFIELIKSIPGISENYRVLIFSLILFGGLFFYVKQHRRKSLKEAIDLTKEVKFLTHKMLPLLYNIKSSQDDFEILKAEIEKFIHTEAFQNFEGDLGIVCKKIIELGIDTKLAKELYPEIKNCREIIIQINESLALVGSNHLTFRTALIDSAVKRLEKEIPFKT